MQMGDLFFVSDCLVFEHKNIAGLSSSPFIYPGTATGCVTPMGHCLISLLRYRRFVVLIDGVTLCRFNERSGRGEQLTGCLGGHQEQRRTGRCSGAMYCLSLFPSSSLPSPQQQQQQQQPWQRQSQPWAPTVSKFNYERGDGRRLGSRGSPNAGPAPASPPRSRRRRRRRRGENEALIRTQSRRDSAVASADNVAYKRAEISLIEMEAQYRTQLESSSATRHQTLAQRYGDDLICSSHCSPCTRSPTNKKERNKTSDVVSRRCGDYMHHAEISNIL